MSDEYLYAYRQENKAAEELGFEAAGDGLAKTDAEKVARNGEEEGDNADDKEWERHVRERRVAQAAEGDAHGKGVDTRGYGKHDLGAKARGIEMGMGLVVIVERLLHHLAANEGKQTEGKPVVNGFEVGAEE